MDDQQRNPEEEDIDRLEREFDESARYENFEQRPIKEDVKAAWGWFKGKAQKAKEDFDAWSAEQEVKAAERRREEEARRKQQEEADRRERRAKLDHSVAISGVANPDEDQPAHPTFMLVLPKGETWRPHAATALIQSLESGLQIEEGGILARFGIYANAREIFWTVSIIRSYKVTPYTAKEIQDLFKSQYPNIEVIPYSFPSGINKYRRYTNFVAHQQHYAEPAYSALDIRGFDPLTAITQVMDSLEEGELVRYEVLVSDVHIATHDSLMKDFTVSAYEAGHRGRIGYTKDWAEFTGAVVGKMWADSKLKKQRVDAFDAPTMERYLRKATRPLYIARLMLTFDSPDPQRLAYMESLVASVGRLSTSATSYSLSVNNFNVAAEKTRIQDDDDDGLFLPIPQYNYFVLDNEKLLKEAMERDDDEAMEAFMSKMPQVDNLYLAEEIAAFWHLPYDGFDQNNIVWKQNVPSELLDPDIEGVEIGKIGIGEAVQPVRIAQADFAYHVFITGKTGMGKSVLSHNILHHHITNGYGVVVLDPHGNLIRQTLDSATATGRMDDVVYLDASDIEYPIPLNFLRLTTNETETDNFETALWTIKSIYSGINWESAPHVENVLSNILQAILVDPDTTLLDVSRVANNADFRRRTLNKLKAQKTASRSSFDYWDDYEPKSPAAKSTEMRPILGRLSTFFRTRHIEHLTCHPGSIDFQKMIGEHKIVLVDLSGNLILNEVGTIGAIFFAQLLLASMALGEIPEGSPPRCYLAVDETHRFITTALPDMFSQARKFGLSLLLATQYIGQLPTETQMGISRNVSTKFSFAADPDDATKISKLYEPDVDALTIQNLDVGHAALKTRFRGASMPGFVLQTNPPIQIHKSLAQLEELKQQAREQVPYTTSKGSHTGLMPVDEVEQWIDARYDSALFKPDPEEDGGLSDWQPEEDS